MNNTILTIEHASSSISSQLKCPRLEYYNQSKDEDIHKWLLTNKSVLLNIQKLIIPIRLGQEDAEYMGLYLGLHIRLTRELDNIRFLPILFISEDTKDEILANQINNHKEKSGLLLFTRGSYLLSAFDLNDYLSKQLTSLDNENYESDFLNQIILSLPDRYGKHSLANVWGAFRLAKFAGYSLNLEKPTSLYFKYKDSFTNNEVIPDSNTNIGVFNDSCRALLIDDNADSGWSSILAFILKSKIIRSGIRISLDVIKTFEEAMECNDYLKYDIIFLDLRLLQSEDKGNHINDIEQFSGTKVLRRIRDVNKGIQVIVFTASNKVWYIESLLEIGAYGYYIKESPEYTLNNSFSKENYKGLLGTIQKSLKLKFLKPFCEIQKKCLASISSNRTVKSIGYQQFFDRTIAAFEISLELLVKVSQKPKYLNLAYLTLFQIIEDFVSQRENFEIFSNRKCYAGQSRIKVVDDSSGILVWKLTFKKDKVNGDYFEIGDATLLQEVPIQTLAKVSFALVFMFNKDNICLKKWANLNNIRNTKAGHGGDKGYVKIENIDELLEIIELILT